MIKHRQANLKKTTHVFGEVWVTPQSPTLAIYLLLNTPWKWPARFHPFMRGFQNSQRYHVLFQTNLITRRVFTPCVFPSKGELCPWSLKRSFPWLTPAVNMTHVSVYWLFVHEWPAPQTAIFISHNNITKSMWRQWTKRKDQDGRWDEKKQNKTRNAGRASKES